MKLKVLDSKGLYNKYKGLNVKDYKYRDCIICGYIIDSCDYVKNWVVVAYSERIGWRLSDPVLKCYINPKYKESESFLFVDFNKLKL